MIFVFYYYNYYTMIDKIGLRLIVELGEVMDLNYLECIGKNQFANDFSNLMILQVFCFVSQYMTWTAFIITMAASEVYGWSKRNRTFSYFKLTGAQCQIFSDFAHVLNNDKNRSISFVWYKILPHIKHRVLIRDLLNTIQYNITSSLN